jgi:predicted DNA-binding transcriptional regulator AlpA
MRKIISGNKNIGKVTGLSITTVWRMEQKGLFPKRIQLSPNRTGWFEDEVEEWQETRPRGVDGRVFSQKTDAKTERLSNGSFYPVEITD